MIAIFGGTFDPVHLGHLRVAWEAAESLGCVVRLLPARTPPHRAAPVASAEERTAILAAALAGQQRLVLDTRELARATPSWTVDTLRELRREAGPAESIVVILGADAFAALPSWHEWEALLELAHFGVLSRPGSEMAVPAEVLARFPGCVARDAAELHGSAHGRVLFIEVTALDISATRVRRLLAAGREPRYLLPEALLGRAELLAPYRRPRG